MYDLALRAAGCDPFLNLGLEESLLERYDGRESLLLFYIDDPCIVIGRNQNPWIEVASGSTLPVLRRISGGGAVYHDRGNLNWSLIVPRSRHDREAELAAIAKAVGSLGIEVETGPRGGLFVAGEGPWKGAKVSGTARRFSSTRVLHHGTLLVDADLGLLASSLGGLEAENSKALPSVRSRSVNLTSLAPGLRMEELILALARELSAGGLRDAETLADRDYAGASALRLSTWEWTWGATPYFTLALPTAGGKATIEVKAGCVASVSGPGSEQLAAIAGHRFDYETAAAAALVLDGSGASFS
jgi:lipoate---protein ligase